MSEPDCPGARPGGARNFGEYLDHPGRLLVWSLRRWVLGLRHNRAAHWSMIWNEFAKRLGTQDGKAALSALFALLRELEQGARRPLRYHPPCCPCLTADEIAVLHFVQACQSQQRCLARSLAEWMVRSEHAGAFLEAGAQLAGTLDRGGLRLLDWTEAEPAIPAARGARQISTIH